MYFHFATEVWRSRLAGKSTHKIASRVVHLSTTNRRLLNVPSSDLQIKNYLEMMSPMQYDITHSDKNWQEKMSRKCWEKNVLLYLFWWNSERMLLNSEDSSHCVLRLGKVTCTVPLHLWLFPVVSYNQEKVESETVKSYFSLYYICF